MAGRSRGVLGSGPLKRRAVVVLGVALALLPWGRIVSANPPEDSAESTERGADARRAAIGAAAATAHAQGVLAAPRAGASELGSGEIRAQVSGLGPGSPDAPKGGTGPEEASLSDESEGGEWDSDEDALGADDSERPDFDPPAGPQSVDDTSPWEHMDAWTGSGPDALRGLGVAPLLHDPRAKTRGKADADAEPELEAESEGDDAAELEPSATPATISLKPRWIKVEVIGGDRLEEIAQRYGVSRSSIIRWNKLDEKKPFIRKGQELRVRTDRDVAPREKITYAVQKGDTWGKIADQHGVDVDRLHLWNRKVPTRFKAGEKLVVYVEPLPVADDEVIAAGATARSGKDGAMTGRGSANARAAAIPLAKIRMDSRSTGRPNRGHIQNSVQIPENPKLYTLRNPDQSYGSSHAIMQLQSGFANFRRDYHYAGQIYIGDMSKKGGGRLSPHSSHQSGRDVDIRLPVVAGVKGPASSVSEVDWDAAWALIKSIVDTGEVEYVFLTHDRQKQLYAAARRAGESKASLARYMQYPNPPKTNHGIVRHSKGHTVHFHVRFHCGPKESQCDSGR